MQYKKRHVTNQFVNTKRLRKRSISSELLSAPNAKSAVSDGALHCRGFIVAASPELEIRGVRRAVVLLHDQLPAGVLQRRAGLPDVGGLIRVRVISEIA